MTKYPCQSCKGEGTWIEVVLEETGEGPTESCGWCQGEGMIEHGTKVHRDICITKAFDLINTRFMPKEEMDAETAEEINVQEAAIEKMLIKLYNTSFGL